MEQITTWTYKGNSTIGTYKAEYNRIDSKGTVYVHQGLTFTNHPTRAVELVFMRSIPRYGEHEFSRGHISLINGRIYELTDFLDINRYERELLEVFIEGICIEDACGKPENISPHEDIAKGVQTIIQYLNEKFALQQGRN